MNLKELAKTLGLSQTTVSRALNGYPEVNEATRARVLLAAKQHSYRPNIRAKGLATGRAMAIGHVIPITTKHEMVNPVFADFIAGAGETYAKAGYEMIISVVDDGDEAQVYRALKSRGTVDGVILHAPRMNDSRIALLDRIGLPYGVHGRVSGHTGPYCWLDVNNRSAFRRATGYLMELGHRRILLVNGPEAMDFADRRRRGYLDALAEHGMTPDPDLMRSEEMTEGYGYRAAVAAMELPDPPTAYLVSSIICALGVRRAVEERGLAIGRDVSIVIHDDALSYLQNGGDPPVFTATRSSVRQAGRRLAELLLDTIANPGHAPHQELLEAELVIGRSTGPGPAITTPTTTR